MSLQVVSSFVTHISLDWVVLGVFALMVALDALRAGSSRPVALAFALPLTLIMLNSVSGAWLITGFESQLSTPLLKAAFVAIILVALFILMYRMTDTFGADSYHPIQALLAGLAVAAVAVVAWLQIPALDAVWHFGTQVQGLFGATYRFWWLLIAYIALAFARG